MKKKSTQPPPLTAMLTAVHKTRYHKGSAEILFYNFRGLSAHGLAAQFKIEGVTLNLIFCSGKLRRRERRQVVKALLLYFKFDYLKDIKIGRKTYRGAFFFPKNAEVTK